MTTRFPSDSPDEAEADVEDFPHEAGCRCVHCAYARYFDAFDEAYARALARSDDHDHWS